MWYTVAGIRLVHMVVTQDPKGRLESRAYFCTNPSIYVEDILINYARRWTLEVAFRNAKQAMGLQDPQNGWWRRHVQRCVMWSDLAYRLVAEDCTEPSVSNST